MQRDSLVEPEGVNAGSAEELQEPEASSPQARQDLEESARGGGHPPADPSSGVRPADDLDPEAEQPAGSAADDATEPYPGLTDAPPSQDAGSIE